MASRSCVSGCGRFLASSDGHGRCVSCLGYQHTESALVDESCCGPDASSSNEGVSHSPCPFLVPPRLCSEGISPNGYGDLRITVRASPSSASLRASHSSSTSHHLVFLDEFAGSSDRAGLSISSEVPADDMMPIAASKDELGSGDDDSAALTAMLSRAAESVGLHWRSPPSPECSRLDDWFLGAQANLRQLPQVPFFLDVHEEVTSS